MDFRSEQCAAYNNATYGGKLYDWLPYTDRKNPCALYCIAKGTRTVVRLAPKVLDGTRCRYSAFDMCISGKCWACNRQICPTWYDGQWSPIQDTWQNMMKREMTLGELRDGNVDPDLEMGVIVHENDVDNHDMSTPKFVVSSWSGCSVTCGTGVRQRFVRCQVRLVYLRDIVDLADTECQSVKPADTEVCKLDPCYQDHEWRAVGTQESLIECVHKINNTAAPEENCKQATPIPIQRRSCNDFPCPQRWRIGDFGACSTTCGGGLMSREVTCIQEVSLVTDKVLTLPDFMCQKPVPQRARPCNTQYCPADWATGFWSERVSRDGVPIDVDGYHCPPTEKPESERACNEGTCPTIRIKRQTMRFFQLNKMNKVRLVVGAEAAILPGTSVIASCPVRGMSKRQIEWLKNGRPLRQTRRSYISNNGKLRIRRSRPDRDTANYTCIAGPERAGLEIVFSDLYTILQETALREKYLLGFLADSPSENSSAYHRDPFDRQQRPLQTRMVSCEIITKDYYETFTERVCRKAGLHVPASSTKCGVQPCVKWTVTEWTPSSGFLNTFRARVSYAFDSISCSVDNCVADGLAVQNRTTRCTAERNASYVSDDHCDVRLKPSVSRMCDIPQCRAIWNTSEWSARQELEGESLEDWNTKRNH
nr:hypothetical protein BaRGS_000600 [Batillaria attramentaria]